MVEGGINGAAGPDHGYGKICYLTLGGGAVVSQDDNNGVVPPAATFQWVNKYVESSSLMCDTLSSVLVVRINEIIQRGRLKC